MDFTFSLFIHVYLSFDSFFYFIHTMLGLLGIWAFQFIVILEILALLAV